MATRRPTREEIPLWRLLKDGKEPALILPSGRRYALYTGIPLVPQIREALLEVPEAERQAVLLQVYLPVERTFVYRRVLPPCQLRKRRYRKGGDRGTLTAHR